MATIVSIVTHHCCVDCNIDTFQRFYREKEQLLNETDRASSVYYALMNRQFAKAQLVLANNNEVYQKALQYIVEDYWRSLTVAMPIRRVDIDKFYQIMMFFFRKEPMKELATFTLPNSGEQNAGLLNQVEQSLLANLNRLLRSFLPDNNEHQSLLDDLSVLLQ